MYAAVSMALYVLFCPFLMPKDHSDLLVSSVGLLVIFVVPDAKLDVLKSMNRLYNFSAYNLTF
jgi:hypothetical protein